MTSNPIVHHLLEPFLLRNTNNNVTLMSENTLKMQTAIEEQLQLLSSPVAYSNLVSHLNESAQHLIRFESKQYGNRYKMDGISVLDCLLDINDEVKPERRMQMGEILKRILDNEKMLDNNTEIVLRMAIMALGHLARVATISEIEELQQSYLPTALSWLSDYKSEVHRYCGALLVRQFALNSPEIIFATMIRDDLFEVMWELVGDRNKIVRNAAKEALEEILVLVSQRESVYKYIRLALVKVNDGLHTNLSLSSSSSSSSILSSKDNERVVGALLIYNIMLNGRVVPTSELISIMKEMDMLVEESISQVLLRRTSKNSDVRSIVIELIPILARAFGHIFLQIIPFSQPKTILAFCVEYLIEEIHNKHDKDNDNMIIRATAYTSLGLLYRAMSSFLKTSTEWTYEVMDAIEKGFSDPFCPEATDCLGSILISSHICRKLMSPGLITQMFQGGLTLSLIDCLKLITKAVPRLRVYVQSYLGSHITGILKRNLNRSLIDRSHSTSYSSNKSGFESRQGYSHGTSTKRSLRKSISDLGISIMSSIGNKNRLTASLNTDSNFNNTIANYSNNYSSNDSSMISSSPSSDEQIVLALQVLASFELFPKRSTTVSNTATINVDTNTTADKNNTSAIVSSDTIGGDEVEIHFPITNGLNHVDNTTTATIITNATEDKEIEEGNDLAQTIMLLSVVGSAVVRYFDDTNYYIRKAAVLSSITVLDKVISPDLPIELYNIVTNVVSRLLVLGVADDNPEIRCSVFDCLTPSLDQIVANCDSINCVVEALSDEILIVRASAMSVLARVAHYDLVHIMPLVRRGLSNLMRQLQTSKDQELRQESMFVLQAMVRGSGLLMVPYSPQILELLLNLLHDTSASISGAALSTIGELALSSPELLRGPLDRILPVIVSALGDQTAVAMQEIAVVALGKLVKSLNITSNLYSTYPNLFENLVTVIKNKDEASGTLRLQATRTAGLLGVVELTVFQNYISSSKSTDLTEIDRYDTLALLANNNKMNMNANKINAYHNINNKYNFSNKTGNIYGNVGGGVTTSVNVVPSKGEQDWYHLSVIMRALTNILRDTTIAGHWGAALSTAMRIAKVVGKNVTATAPIIIDGIIYRLYQEPGNSFEESLIDALITLVHLIGEAIDPFTNDLLKVVGHYFEVHIELCLEMVEVLCSVLPPHSFHSVLQVLVPSMLKTIRDEPLHEIDNSANKNTFTNSNILPYTTTTTSNTTTTSSSNNSMNNSSSNIRDINILETTHYSSGSSLSMKLPRTSKIMRAIANMSTALGEYRSQLIPIILKVMSRSDVIVQTRRDALCTVMHLALDSNDLNEFSSRIIHPLLRNLTLPPKGTALELTMVSSSLVALSCILCRLRVAYIPFIIPVHRKTNLLMNNLSTDQSTKLPQLQVYNTLVERLLKDRPLPVEAPLLHEIEIRSDEKLKARVLNARNPVPIGNVNMQALETAWALSASSRTTSADIVDWSRRLSIEFLRQSPSPTLKQCAALAKSYQPLAQQLLNVSFMSLWDDSFALDNGAVSESCNLIDSLELALRSPHIPKKIMQNIVNLAEYMEMRDKSLPFDVHLLASCAAQTSMFAKSLHYREIEFNSQHIAPSAEVMESLITINNQLGLHSAAAGILKCVQTRYRDQVTIRPRWLEELSRWEEASTLYHQFQSETINKYTIDEKAKEIYCKDKEWIEYELGIMRCQHALGEYEELIDSAAALKGHIENSYANLVHTSNDNTTTSSDVMNDITTGTTTSSIITKTIDDRDQWLAEVQRLGSSASWMLGSWGDLEAFMDRDFPESKDRERPEDCSSFYNALISIHNLNFSKAQRLISETRDSLADRVGELLTKNYSRANRAMVTMQVLAELEEVIEFKQYEETTAMLAESRATFEAEKLLSIDLENNFEALRQQYSSKSYEWKLSEVASKKRALLSKWESRLAYAPGDVNVYRQVLAVHMLIADPQEDLSSWIRLVTLCRNEGMLTLCENILRRLGAPLPPKRKNHNSKEFLEVIRNVDQGLGDVLDTELNVGESDSGFAIDDNDKIIRETTVPVKSDVNDGNIADISGDTSYSGRSGVEVDTLTNMNMSMINSKIVTDVSSDAVQKLEDIDRSSHTTSTHSYKDDSDTISTPLEALSNNDRDVIDDTISIHTNQTTTPSTAAAAVDYELTDITTTIKTSINQGDDKMSTDKSNNIGGSGNGSSSNDNGNTQVVGATSIDKKNVIDHDIDEINADLSIPEDVHSEVIYSMYKLWWQQGHREKALTGLQYLLDNRLSEVGRSIRAASTGRSRNSIRKKRPGSTTTDSTTTGSSSGTNLEWEEQQITLKVRCLLKCAEWMKVLRRDSLGDVLQTVRTARELNPNHYSVWHAWAVTNYDQLQLADEAEELSPYPSDVFLFRTVGFDVSNVNNVNNNVRNTPLVYDNIAPTNSTVSPTKVTRDNQANRQGRGASLANLTRGQTDLVTRYVVESIRGFIRSINLGTDQPIAFILQDILRLMTLWFTYGSKPQVYRILDSEMLSIPVENWLQVVPQLIARIHIHNQKISAVLKRLLTKVATEHPQALVWPLAAAGAVESSSHNNDNKNESNVHVLQQAFVNEVLSEMMVHDEGDRLVDEARRISQELMRVAVTPNEAWHEGLEEAAALYKVDGDVDGMLQRLYSLHTSFDEIHNPPARDNNYNPNRSTFDTANTSHHNPSHSYNSSNLYSNNSDSNLLPTLRDISFVQAYGRDIQSARRWLDNYSDTKALPSLHQAWDLYHSIFRRITKQLKSIKRLELGHVTRELSWAGGTASSTALSLAIPGTYKPFKELIRIQRIATTVEVIASKQRPRRMTMVGSDGKHYRFLLKGHEDLRQDERVMQLFGLINVCLSSDKSSQASGLNIVRYSVLPLSNDSGLIGWVENCDTLSQLIRSYRESRGIPLNVEQSLLDRRAPDYKKLPLLSKIECFTQVLKDTSGADIAKMFWLKSRTAEAWIERRTNYTRSIAVMSMVGYILGLGDRHLANLMLDRISGRIVHIDFGDCFEVSLHRQKYPETVPFRLTRMIINTMEASGTEGTFRSSCEKVMRVLRRNDDSVMAMLEVFVYDPLISWKLLSSQIAQANAQAQSQAVASPTGSSSSSSSSQIIDSTQIPVKNNNSHIDDVSAVLAGVDNVVSDAHNHTTSLNQLPGLPPLSLSSYRESRESIRERFLTGISTGMTNDTSGPGSTSSTAHVGDENEPLEELNARALEVINRIQAKLTGRDFNTSSHQIRYKHSIEKFGVLQTENHEPQSLSILTSNTNKHSGIMETSNSSFNLSISQSNSSKDYLTSLTASNSLNDGMTTSASLSAQTTDTTDTNSTSPSKDINAELSVESQVEMLVSQATSIENLCLLYPGWGAFW